jgi:CDP-diacylglycerol--glycerol-3-phosphate 3-phosphatidyltransferase
MTPPNLITLARVVAIPVVMALILAGFSGHDYWAALAYVLAAASDSLDGYLARSRHWQTVAGAFLDPLADKLLVTGALICLVQIDRLSSWAAMAIVAREFAVSGLRLIAISGQEVIAASWAGKLKTFAQNLAIVALLVIHDHRLLVDVLVGIAIALSWLSLGGYAARAWRHFGARAPGAVS